MVGREEELEFIERLLDDRHATGAVVAGRAGVGKTRLVAEAADRAMQAGWIVLRATGTHAGSAIPFGALAHLLPATLHGGPTRFNLLRAAADALLPDGSGRCLLTVDDAHLLDDASVALVHNLAVSSRAFVLLSARSGMTAPEALVALWKDGIADRVEVQPLSRDECATLVEAALGSQVDAATLHLLWNRTGGNPLYLRELVLSGLNAGSLVDIDGVWRWTGGLAPGPRLAEVIETRLGVLDEDERSALQIVAVADHVGATLLYELVEEAAVERLDDKGLVRVVVDGRRLRVEVAHPLYAEAVRSATPVLRARTIRLGLADALRSTGARRRDDLLRLAVWTVDGGRLLDPDLLLSAARKAASVFDFALAERLSDAALEAGGGFDASLTLAQALVGAGRFAQAEDLFADIYLTAGDEIERVQVGLARAANLFWHQDDPQTAERVLDETEARVLTADARDELAATRVAVWLFGGRTDDAMALADSILARDDVHPRAVLQTAMSIIWGYALVGRTSDARDLAERCLDLAAASPGEMPFALSWFRATYWAAHYFDGNLAQAEAGSRALYQDAVRQGADWAQAVLGWGLAWIQQLQGKIRTNRRLLRQSVSILRSADLYNHLPLCLADLARCHAMLGEVSAAEDCLAEADQTRLASLRMADFHLGLARCWVAVAWGDLSGGVDAARDTARVTGRMGQLVYQALALHTVARLGEAGEVVDDLSDLARRVEGRLVPALADHAAAIAAQDADRLEQVSATFEGMGAALFAGEAAARAASIHRAAGRTGSALGARARATVLADLCEGAVTPALADLDRELPLTPREREVATLAARGLSNREISERLVVSVRTVDNHLHRSYTKLGVSGRDELAAILVPDGAPVPGDGTGEPN